VSHWIQVVNTSCHNEVLSGYQPGQMVERRENKRFEDHLCPQPFDPVDSPTELHHTQSPGKQQISLLHVMVFWIKIPCNDVAEYNVSKGHATSIFRKT
jgi:hypothetical protein